MEKENLQKKFSELRDSIIEKYFSYLSDEQIEAVLANDRKILVSACPGAGKTQVIVSRIIYLMTFGTTYRSEKYPEGLSFCDINMLEEILKSGDQLKNREIPSSLRHFAENPENIFVITFTRMAAKNMEGRFKRIIGQKTCKIPFFGTFHSFFFKIIKENFSAPYIIDESAAFGVVQNTLKDYTDSPSDEKTDGVMSDISLFKVLDNMDAKCAIKSDREVFSRCFLEYEKFKKSTNLMDFDDLAIECLKVLETDEKAFYNFCGKINHMLVDEFQDCDSPQIKVLKLISKISSIFAVGDEDQCIYGFRGSRPDCMVNFENHFKDGKKLFLSRNYRSGSCIINAAGTLIKMNACRNDKEMVGARNENGSLEFIACESEKQQTDKTAELVVSLLSKCEEEEIAILYRTNREAAPFAVSLAKNGIQYHIAERKNSFPQNSVLWDIVSYFKLSINIFDKESFIRIINKPYRFIGKTKIERLKECKYKKNPFRFISEMNDVSASQVAMLWRLERQIKKMGKMDLQKAFDYLMKKIGYLDFAEKNAVNAGSLEEAMTLIEEFSRIEEFLKFIERYQTADKDSRNNGGVTLSTIHGVKGLEFKNVIIVNCMDGNMPHNKNIKNIEEERRLFYVGITRAVDNLWLLYPETGKTKENKISPFIGESGIKLF